MGQLQQGGDFISEKIQVFVQLIWGVQWAASVTGRKRDHDLEIFEILSMLLGRDTLKQERNRRKRNKIGVGVMINDFMEYILEMEEEIEKKMRYTNTVNHNVTR